MEVLVGPTFSIEVSSPPAAAGYVVPSSSQEKLHGSAAACIFLKEDEVEGSGSLISRSIGSGIGINGPEDSSDSSSSIGAPDDSDEEGEEVGSVGLSKGALGSLDSLEESLPIKRGLSNHFTGKSKSFANLSEVSCASTVKDLEKQENPFNKRRKLVMATKWCRKAKSSFYSWPNPKSMPLLTLNEEGDDDREQEEQDNEEQEYQASPFSSSPEQDVLRNQPKLSKLQEKKFNTSFKSHSCFSLTDLQDEQFQ